MMLTRTMDIQQIASVEELWALLEKDTEIILTEGGEPLARLTQVEKPILPKGERIPDLHPGLWMSDDFDDPLPDEFWLGEDRMDRL